MSMGATRKGSLVAAKIVARWVGVDCRTMHAWIEKKYIKGCKIGTRYYVNRRVAERLRDGESPEEAQE